MIKAYWPWRWVHRRVRRFSPFKSRKQELFSTEEVIRACLGQIPSPRSPMLSPHAILELLLPPSLDAPGEDDAADAKADASFLPLLKDATTAVGLLYDKANNTPCRHGTSPSARVSLREFATALTSLSPMVVSITSTDGIISSVTESCTDAQLRALRVHWQPWISPVIQKKMSAMVPMGDAESEQMWDTFFALMPPYYVPLDLVRERCSRSSISWEALGRMPFAAMIAYSAGGVLMRLAPPQGQQQHHLSQPQHSIACSYNGGGAHVHYAMLPSRVTLFYAAVDLLAAVVPTLFVPLHSISVLYSDILDAAAKNCELLQKHFPRVEALLDHPDLACFVERRDRATLEPIEATERRLDDSVVVRLHPSFSHNEKGQADRHYLAATIIQHMHGASIGQPRRADDRERRRHVKAYHVHVHTGGMTTSEVEPIFKQLMKSVGAAGEAPPRVLVMRIAGSALSSSKHAAELHMGFLSTHRGEAVINAFRLVMENVPEAAMGTAVSTEDDWLCSALPPLFVGAITCESIVKILVNNNADDDTHTGAQSLVQHLRALCGVMGDLQSLVQFFGYPIGELHLNAKALTSLILLRARSAVVDARLLPPQQVVMSASSSSEAVPITTAFIHLAEAVVVAQHVIDEGRKWTAPHWQQFLQLAPVYREDHALSERIGAYLAELQEVCDHTSVLALLPGGAAGVAQVSALDVSRKRSLLKDLVFLFGPECTQPEVQPLAAAAAVVVAAPHNTVVVREPAGAHAGNGNTLAHERHVLDDAVVPPPQVDCRAHAVTAAAYDPMVALRRDAEDLTKPPTTDPPRALLPSHAAGAAAEHDPGISGCDGANGGKVEEEEEDYLAALAPPEQPQQEQKTSSVAPASGVSAPCSGGGIDDADLLGLLEEVNTTTSSAASQKKPARSRPPQTPRERPAPVSSALGGPTIGLFEAPHVTTDSITRRDPSRLPSPYSTGGRGGRGGYNRGGGGGGGGGGGYRGGRASGFANTRSADRQHVSQSTPFSLGDVSRWCSSTPPPAAEAPHQRHHSANHIPNGAGLVRPVPPPPPHVIAESEKQQMRSLIADLLHAPAAPLPPPPPAPPQPQPVQSDRSHHPSNNVGMSDGDLRVLLRTDAGRSLLRELL